MKKFLSVVLSLMMVLAVGFGTSAVAFAYVGSPSEIIVEQIQVATTNKVNKNNSTKVKGHKDTNNYNKIVFEYEGSEAVDSWEIYDGDKLLVEGVDYKIVSKSDKEIVISIIAVPADVLSANAVVNGAQKPAKPNNGNQSPATGAMAATGLAMAGAGLAVLTALKRKNDAE